MKPLRPRKAPFFGLRRIRWHSLRVRDVVILTLPVWVLLGLLANDAVNRYREALSYGDWFSQGKTTRTFLAYRLWELATLPGRAALRLSLESESDDPGVIRLLVPRDQWAAWEADPFAFFGTWVDADLAEGNALRQVRIRKRGDTSVHWATDKKSFTLKTPRDNLLKGYRELAFSGKQVVPQLVANGLAQEFDLLAPYTAPAAVFVNGSFYGMFRVTEIIDESLLRHEHRMPGNVYRGETAERGEVFLGLPRILFENPYLWDRVAFNDRPGAPDRTALRQWIADSCGSTFEDHQELMRWMDPRELSRLFAYLLAVGDLTHLSNLHNEFWFEDPAAGSLHPIVWDIRLQPFDEVPTQQINELYRAVLRDPAVFHGSMEVLSEKLESGAIERAAGAILADAEARFPAHFAYDRMRRGRVPDVGSPGEVRAVLERNLAELRTWLDDARVRFHGGAGRQGLVLDFLADGRAATLLEALEVPGTATLYADSNRNGVRDAADRLVPTHFEKAGSGGRLVLDSGELLLPGVASDLFQILPGPLHYRFFLADAAGPVRPVLRNVHTRAAVQAAAWAGGEAVATAASFHPWQVPTPEPSLRSLSGTVHLTEDLILAAHETLDIAPGTTLLLDPDVSLYTRGKVLARGTATEPIEVLRADPDAPWGTFVIQGPGGNGSVLEFVRFLGGGGAELERVEYKGMVCVHWARDVKIRGCTFARNVRCDDGMNAVHAGVDLRDCVFEDVNADALDFDYSWGEVTGCTFRNTRNDGMDCMTSEAWIHGNTFVNCGDKGVSVGENSRLWVVGNRFQDCVKALEVKDCSEPWIAYNHIQGSEVAIAEKSKNWRYGCGGWGKSLGNVLADNQQDLDADVHSRFTRFEPGAGDVPGWFTALSGFSRNGPQWDFRPAAPPLATLSFPEDFVDATDGWTYAGGVTWLAKRQDGLVANVSWKRGEIAREVQWNFNDSTKEYVALFELSCSSFLSGSLAVVSDRETVTVPVPTTADGEFRLVPVRLPPGQYREIRFELTPTSTDGGRLALHGCRVVPVPSEP